MRKITLDEMSMLRWGHKSFYQDTNVCCFEFRKDKLFFVVENFGQKMSRAYILSKIDDKVIRVYHLTTKRKPVNISDSIAASLFCKMLGNAVENKREQVEEQRKRVERERERLYTEEKILKILELCHNGNSSDNT